MQECPDPDCSWRTGTAEVILSWAPIPCVPIGKAASWWKRGCQGWDLCASVSPLWELKASVVPGSGHNSWIFLPPSLASIKNIYYLYLPAKLLYSTFFLHTKLFTEKIWFTFFYLRKASQKGSKLYCSCQIPGGKRHSGQSSLCHSL